MMQQRRPNSGEYESKVARGGLVADKHLFRRGETKRLRRLRVEMEMGKGEDTPKSEWGKSASQPANQEHR